MSFCLKHWLCKLIIEYLYSTALDSQLATLASQVATFVADVTSTKQVQAAVEGAIKTFGKLDVVIANAGRAPLLDKGTVLILFSEPLCNILICNLDMVQDDPDDWWNIVEVNLRGTYNIAQ